MSLRWTKRDGLAYLQEWCSHYRVWTDVLLEASEGENMPLGLGLGSEVGRGDAATVVAEAVSPLAYSQQCDESNNHYQSASYSPAITTNDATLSGWVLPRHDNLTCVLLHTGSHEIDPVSSRTGEGSGVLVEIQQNRLHVRCADGSAHIDLYSAAGSLGVWNSGLDSWYHWLVTLDRSGSATIYINGSSSGSPVSMSTVTGSISGTRTDISCRHEQINGLIGNCAAVRVFNAVLDASERSQDYNSGDGCLYGSLTAGLQAKVINSWDLQTSSGAAIDAKGTQNISASGSQTRVNGPSEAVTALSRVNLTSYSSDLANAITSIGSDIKVLNINVSTTLGAQATVPENITIQFVSDSYQIDTQSSHNLIFEGGVFGEYSGVIGGLEKVDLNGSAGYIWVDWSDQSNDWDKRDDALASIKSSTRKRLKLPRRNLQWEDTSNADWEWSAATLNGTMMYGDDRDDCVLQARADFGHLIVITSAPDNLNFNDFTLSADSTVGSAHTVTGIYMTADTAANNTCDPLNIRRLKCEKMNNGIDLCSHNGVFHDLLIKQCDMHGFIFNHGIGNTLNNFIIRDNGGYGMDFAGGFDAELKHTITCTDGYIIDNGFGNAKLACYVGSPHDVKHYWDVVLDTVHLEQTVDGRGQMTVTGAYDFSTGSSSSDGNSEAKLTLRDCTFVGSGGGSVGGPNIFGIGTIVLAGHNTFRNHGGYGANFEPKYAINDASYGNTVGALTCSSAVITSTDNGSWGIRFGGDETITLDLDSATISDNAGNGIQVDATGAAWSGKPHLSLNGGSISGNDDYGIEGLSTGAAGDYLVDGVTFSGNGSGGINMVGTATTDVCEISNCVGTGQSTSRLADDGVSVDFTNSNFKDAGSNTDMTS